MFESLQMAPADPILGLAEVFRNDPRSDKINLSVGVFQDENGCTPILDVVKEAERALLDAETTKDYLPIPGEAEFGRSVRALLFGVDSNLSSGGRAVTAHAPGGTGALRIAADLLARHRHGSRLWVSAPTWPNHPGVFGAAGLETLSYPWYDATSGTVDQERFLEALRAIPANDVVVLHGCCHNPTGADADRDTWGQITTIAAERGWLPMVDFAYQGFGDGLDVDALGVRLLAQRVPELLVASSFSKNFGLYRERVGALTLVAAKPAAAEVALSQLKLVIRASYSNPPAHGGLVVSRVLGDLALRARWEDQVTAMRNRLNQMRQMLARHLADLKVGRDFSFLDKGRGMFALTGLSSEQVGVLRDTFGVYLIGSGRINVAGLTPANIDRVASAIAAVL